MQMPEWLGSYFKDEEGKSEQEEWDDKNKWLHVYFVLQV